MYASGTSEVSPERADRWKAEDSVSLAAARYLLTSPLLESPVLPMALLSGFAHHQEELLQTLKNFLKEYRGGKKERKKKRENRKKNFFFFAFQIFNFLFLSLSV